MTPKKAMRFLSIGLVAGLVGYIGYYLLAGRFSIQANYADIYAYKRLSHQVKLSDFLDKNQVFTQGLHTTDIASTSNRVKPRFVRVILTDEPQAVALVPGPDNQRLVSYSADYAPYVGIYTIKLQVVKRQIDTLENFTNNVAFNLLRAILRQTGQDALADTEQLRQMDRQISDIIKTDWQEQLPFGIGEGKPGFFWFNIVRQAHALYCGSTGIIECGTTAVVWGCKVPGQEGNIACLGLIDNVCNAYGGCIENLPGCYYGAPIPGLTCQDAPTCTGNPCPTAIV